MSATILPFPERLKRKFVKINRCGERFWLECLLGGGRHTKLGRFDNHLVKPHPYKYGDIIEYLDYEVVDSCDLPDHTPIIKSIKPADGYRIKEVQK